MGNWFSSLFKSDEPAANLSAPSAESAAVPPIAIAAPPTAAAASATGGNDTSAAAPAVAAAAAVAAPAPIPAPAAPAKIDPKSLMCFSLKNQCVFRAPGSIRGNEFIIDDCKNCDFYICDNTAQITVDGCTDCRFFFGPCEASLFMRDCSNNSVVAACQQMRLRNCTEMTFALHCGTEPVIESSKALRFGCFQFAYFSLAEQFAKAGLSIWTNEWSRIHDFTPTSGSLNYALLDADACAPLAMLSGRPLVDAAAGCFDAAELMPVARSLVPLTSPQRKTGACTFVLIAGANASATGVAVLEAIGAAAPHLALRRVRLSPLTADQAARLLEHDSAQASAVGATLAASGGSGDVLVFEFRSDAGMAGDAVAVALDTMRSAAGAVGAARADAGADAAATLFFDEFKPKVF